MGGTVLQGTAVRAPGDGPPDEPALVERARHDVAAFAPLYARYADPVYRYCYRRLGTKEAAEDATSLIFANALAALPRYHAGSFRSWLFAIAHNVVANHLRTARPALSLAATADLAAGTPTPEETVLAAERQRMLRTLLDQLPADQRRVAELRLAGLSGKEIAESMGRSHAAVRMLQQRAIARLRRLLDIEPDAEEAHRDG